MRDICSSCLSDKLTWKFVSGDEKIASTTELHISVKPEWRDKLPLKIGLIKLDIGPKILAFAECDLLIGSTVTLSQNGDIYTFKDKGLI